MMDVDQALARYARVLEGLNAGNIDDLDAVISADVFFRDPFSAVVGRDRMKRIFAKLFEDCTDVRFAVHGRFAEAEGGAVLLWSMTYRLRRFARGGLWQIDGASEVEIDPATGMVTRHVDHWDAAGQFYERLPLIGWLLRLIRRRVETR